MNDSVIVYGSLLSKTQLNDTFNKYETIKVQIDGLSRYMNQRSDVREPESGAVLNVVEESESWINALLVYDISEGFEKYKQRETGYSLDTISASRMQAYDKQEIPVKNSIIPRGQLVVEKNSGYVPIPEYIEECVDGAKDWGPEFVRDFVITTHGFPDD